MGRGFLSHSVLSRRIMYRELKDSDKERESAKTVSTAVAAGPGEGLARARLRLWSRSWAQSHQLTLSPRPGRV